AERHRAGQRLAGQAGGGDALAVVVQQVVAEDVELPLVVAEQVLGGRVADTVGVVLVQVFAFRQGGDRLPVRDLERPLGGAGVGQRLRDAATAGQRDGGRLDQGTDAVGQLARRQLVEAAI